MLAALVFKEQTKTHLKITKKHTQMLSCDVAFCKAVTVSV